MELCEKIEALLFWKGEPVTVPELCRLLKVESGEAKQALLELRTRLAGRGIALIESGDEFALATAPEAGEFIEKIRKNELSKELGKAAIETLSIVLYRGPVARREIDYIRGVNSTAILRTLLVRGLIERTQSESDERMFLYRASIEFLSDLGLSRAADLPEYAELAKELEQAAEQAVLGEKEADETGEEDVQLEPHE